MKEIWMFKRIMTTAAVVAALIGASPAVAATMWGVTTAGDTLYSYASLGDWVTNTASGVHLNPDKSFFSVAVDGATGAFYGMDYGMSGRRLTTYNSLADWVTGTSSGTHQNPGILQFTGVAVHGGTIYALEREAPSNTAGTVLHSFSTLADWVTNNVSGSHFNPSGTLYEDIGLDGAGNFYALRTDGVTADTFAGLGGWVTGTSTGSHLNPIGGQFVGLGVSSNTVVPEPSSFLLVGVGLLGLHLTGRRRRTGQ